MKKIIVIGCPGAGKSTFARALAERTGISLFHLDMIWHRADKTNVSREEFDEKLGELMKNESFIIDGNYMRTLERRIATADTVFFLDYKTEICLEGAKSRIGKKREDMPWTETELDPEFRAWIEDFARDQRPKIYGLLEKYADREIHIFYDRPETERFLKEFYI